MLFSSMNWPAKVVIIADTTKSTLHQVSNQYNNIRSPRQEADAINSYYLISNSNYL